MPKTNMTREPGPMARYETATADGGWLTLHGWNQLGADMMALASCHMRRGKPMPGRAGIVEQLRDRAADCWRRAEALRAKGGAL